MTEKIHNPFDRDNLRHARAAASNYEAARRENDTAAWAGRSALRHTGSDTFSTIARGEQQKREADAQASAASFTAAAESHERAGQRIYMEHPGELHDAARADAEAAGVHIKVTGSSPTEHIDVHQS